MKKTRVVVIVLLIMLLSQSLCFAHSGRTDSSGGHKDNKNVSGLGYYHYHHGYGPHLHPGGVCPYAVSRTSSSSSSASFSRCPRLFAINSCSSGV